VTTNPGTRPGHEVSAAGNRDGVSVANGSDDDRERYLRLRAVEQRQPYPKPEQASTNVLTHELRQRHEAADRLPPLEDGRRDPLDPWDVAS
jgi:hypothetical protein